MAISPDWLNMIVAGGLGAGIAAFIGAFIMLFVVLAIAIYIYTSLALYTIAKKLKYCCPWLMWIPIANIAGILQMGGFHWALVFLILIPILGWIALMVLGIISMWRIYERRKYPGWLALVGLLSLIPFLSILGTIANLVILGLVAWKDNPKF